MLFQRIVCLNRFHYFSVSGKNLFHFKNRFFSTNTNKDLYRSFLFNNAYINGEFCPAHSGQQFSVYNPSNGQLVDKVADCNIDDIRKAVESAKNAFPSWSQTLAKDRAQLLKRLNSLQLDNAEALAQLITAEMGKPIKESRGEIFYGASFLEWFAEEARRIHGEILQTPWNDKQISYRKEAIGVAGIITPVLL